MGKSMRFMKGQRYYWVSDNYKMVGTEEITPNNTMIFEDERDAELELLKRKI